MALAAYRSLLRAIRTAFPNDMAMQVAARTQSHQAFSAARNLPVGSPEATKQIQHANEVAQMLKHNVVQGTKIDGAEEGVYRLRIHDNIERGDNNTIKNPNTGVVSPRVKCCSE